MEDKVTEALEKLLDECAKRLLQKYIQSKPTHNNQEPPVVVESSQSPVPGSLSSNNMLDEMMAPWLLQLLPDDLLYATDSDKTAAVKKLQSLPVKSFVEVKSGATNQLLNLTTIHRAYNNSSVQEDLVGAVFMIFYQKVNRGKIQTADCPVAVPLLVDYLTANTSDTRRHAAASLYLLSNLESNKKTIGELGIGPLTRCMEAETDQMALKFANAALCNLCTVVENRERAVSEGAVMAAIGKIISLNRILDDELNLRLLALLSSHEWRLGETEANRMLHCLCWTLSAEGTSTTMSKECEEQCVVIAHRLRLDSRRIENGRQTLNRIASRGRTATTREKASELLKLGPFWTE